jgi:putative two-component system response regulator
MCRKKLVLVVDDNPVNLSILEEMLCDEYRVKFAQNGPEAIRVAAKCQPTYVLLDVMMPGMDGLEVCQQLRATAGPTPPVIIMVSAKAMPSEQAAGIRAGADDYLTKPFDEVELLETLRRYDGVRTDRVGDAAWDESDDAATVTL